MKKLLLLLLLPFLMGASMQGAGSFTPGISPVGQCLWETVWDAEVVSGDTTWQDYHSEGNRNGRFYVLAADTTGGGNTIRITLKAHSLLLSEIADVAIGPKKASADPYDFDSAPTNVTFSSQDNVAINGGNYMVSNEISFNFSTSTDYIVAIYSEDAYMSYLDYVGAYARKDAVGADESEIVDVSTYTTEDFIEWLVKIEACTN